MKQNFWRWLYKFIFLDIVHGGFFHQKEKPDFSTATSTNDLKSFFKEIGIEIFLDKKKSKEDLSNTSTLIYSNHPTSFDPLMIVVAENLEKVKIVSVLVNKLFFPFYEDRIIPVASTCTTPRLSPGVLQTRVAEKAENFTKDEAEKTNHTVPELAVQSLVQKTPVLIFPPGATNQWHDGIGFIVDEFVRKNPTKKLNFQPLHVSGTTTVGMLWHGWKSLFGFKKPLQMKITRGKNFDLSFLKKEKLLDIEDKKTRAKAIRAFLEEKYSKEFEKEARFYK